jgi:glycosyltransferase involved in cell wall biosynthesis
MILIDLVYINSPGGITISNLLLDYINKQKNSKKFKILLDKRNSRYFEKFNIEKTIISKSELSRYLFYRRNGQDFNSILCFANIPPPFNIRAKTVVYFHNEIFLNQKGLGFSIIKKFIFKIKWIYIKSKNLNYTWFVQTYHMREILIEKLNTNESHVEVHPIYKEEKSKPIKKRPFTFIYPSSNSPHKNNFRLLKAFVEATKKTSKEIELYITIDKLKLDVPKNLKINFLGLIDHNELLSNLKKVEFLIFPSLRESFGLPLIEGIQANCKILCSNLNFAHELISPSYFFNPNDEKSITDVILLALSDKNHPKSSIKIKNSIDLIFNKLNNV